MQNGVLVVSLAKLLANRRIIYLWAPDGFVWCKSGQGRKGYRFPPLFLLFGAGTAAILRVRGRVP
jgi:hypothetical protein